MKLNPIARLFKGGEKPATRLMAVTPPRTGERTLLGVENLLGSIAVPEPFSLEIAGDSERRHPPGPVPGRAPSSASSWASTTPRPG